MQDRTGISRKLFGTNGIRGRPNELLTPEFSVSIGKSIASMFKARRIAMGRDTRLSGPMIFSSVAAGLTSSGTDVVDLGILPTPALQFYCKTNGIPGVVITASHNPPEFNGIKCIDSDGTELAQSKELEIEKAHFSNSFSPAGWESIGTVTGDNTAVDRYLRGVISRIDAQSIAEKNYRVAADPACGAAYYSTPALLGMLGCRITTINGFPDGLFTARNPEPRPENLSVLLSIMKEGNHDLGVAHDGDADRATFVDENGNFIEGDRILSLIVKHHARKGDVIVTPISTSDSIDDVAEEIGATVLRTMVGAPIVARAMMDNRAHIGGEENGGVIFGNHQYCRDGAMTLASVLDIMAKSGSTISELLSGIRKYHIRKGSEHFSGDWESLARHIDEHSNAEKIDRMDGMKIYVDGGWALIRKSGTEPIVRVYAHASSEDSCTRIYNKFIGLVRKFGS